MVLGACDNGNAPSGLDGGAGDMAMATQHDLATTPPDLMPPPCVMNPMTPVEILNACTNAQTGDPAKDYPYFPSLAPLGALPPLP